MGKKTVKDVVGSMHFKSSLVPHPRPQLRLVIMSIKFSNKQCLFVGRGYITKYDLCYRSRFNFSSEYVVLFDLRCRARTSECYLIESFLSGFCRNIQAPAGGFSENGNGLPSRYNL